MDSSVLFAFGVTLVAGLATGVGSAIAFFARRTDYRFLAVAMGFSAGVMLYVSFMEIMPKAEESLAEQYPDGAGWLTVGAFFLGILFIGAIDALIPSPENPHEVRARPELRDVREGGDYEPPQYAHLRRLGLFTAMAIAIHNFPEGLATFLAALESPSLGIAVGVAIALHNIPEGISVSVPIYYASGSKSKAFAYSFFSGLAEPVGALVGYLVLRTVFNDSLMGFTFAAVAGIMVYISLDELLPAARAYGKTHDALYGLMSGMAIMALSLLLLV
jgi:ZIP family zinc transporter